MSAIITRDGDLVVNKWNNDNPTPFRVDTTDMISHVEVEVGNMELSHLTQTLKIIRCGDTQMLQNSEVFEWMKGACWDWKLYIVLLEGFMPALLIPLGFDTCLSEITHMDILIP